MTFVWASEPGHTMHIPYDTLNDEGKRISKRFSKYWYYLLIFHALSLFALLIYTNVAAKPNLLVIEIWMAGTAIGVAMGFFTIERLRNSKLTQYRVLDEDNDQITD